MEDSSKQYSYVSHGEKIREERHNRKHIKYVKHPRHLQSLTSIFYRKKQNNMFKLYQEVTLHTIFLN